VASEVRWRDQPYEAYGNFPSPPPAYPGAPYRARQPQPPYAGAEGWKCSVYYYWWEYLRRHDGYRETCVAEGEGKYAELYKSFGNVHGTDFHNWWWSKYLLFTLVSEAQKIRLSKYHVECEGVFMHVGYARSKSEMVAKVRSEIAKIPQQEINKELLKSIRFKPAARPVLKSLHQHLLAWDAKQQHPDLDDAELCDIAGLEIKLPYTVNEIANLKAEGLKVIDLEKANQRAKQLAVQRHLRIARQYIDNVALGEFPKRSTR